MPIPRVPPRPAPTHDRDRPLFVAADAHSKQHRIEDPVQVELLEEGERARWEGRRERHLRANRDAILVVVEFPSPPSSARHGEIRIKNHRTQLVIPMEGEQSPASKTEALSNAPCSAAT